MLDDRVLAIHLSEGEHTTAQLIDRGPCQNDWLAHGPEEPVGYVGELLFPLLGWQPPDGAQRPHGHVAVGGALVEATCRTLQIPHLIQEILGACGPLGHLGQQGAH